MTLSDRDHHLVTRALALAIEIMDRAQRRHAPLSDLDDMQSLYLALVPDEIERIGHSNGIGWLLSGGLDLRERPRDPFPLGGPPAGPKGGEPMPVPTPSSHPIAA